MAIRCVEGILTLHCIYCTYSTFTHSMMDLEYLYTYNPKEQDSVRD
jgi:hypothetical protein